MHIVALASPDAQAPAGSLRDSLEESKGIDVLRVDLTVNEPEGRCDGAQGWGDGRRVVDDWAEAS